MPADILVDFGADSPQALERAVAARLLADLFEDLDRAVERDPRHHLRMGEMLLRPANFPDPLIGQRPDPRQMPEKGAADRDAALHGRQTVQLGVVQGVEDFAIDIELRLLDGGIADAHRARALVTRQPGDLPFRQPPLAAEPIHDLQLVRAARHRAQEPVAPRPRLVVKPAIHQREQGKGRIAQPAEAIVPIAGAADLLGQRSGRRGDNAAGRGVGQALQHDQRAPDGLAPRARGTAARRPSPPKSLHPAPAPAPRRSDEAAADGKATSSSRTGSARRP